MKKAAFSGIDDWFGKIPVPRNHIERLRRHAEIEIVVTAGIIVRDEPAGSEMGPDRVDLDLLEIAEAFAVEAHPVEIQARIGTGIGDLDLCPVRIGLAPSHGEPCGIERIERFVFRT